jgi:hypothetical protein
VNTAIQTATEPTADFRLVAVKILPVYQRIENGEPVGEPVTFREPVEIHEDRVAELSWGVPLEILLSDVREQLIERGSQGG